MIVEWLTRRHWSRVAGLTLFVPGCLTGPGHRALSRAAIIIAAMLGASFGDGAVLLAHRLCLLPWGAVTRHG